jgi:quercetin dioxygenase-like cupin family protein
VSHMKDIPWGHETHVVEEEKVEKEVAHIPPGEGTRSLWLFGELLTRKVPSRQTGGAYTLFEVATQPAAEPPLHIHHREDEAFYVFVGEYEFLIEGRPIRTGAGSLLYVPKGTLHAHKNVGEGVGRMLVTQTPGGLYELFFESLVFEDQVDAARIPALAARYGIEIMKGENHEA